MQSTRESKFSYHISFFLANNRNDRLPYYTGVLLRVNSRTPILSAALDSNSVSNAELVEYLMDNGANITAVDDKGSIHK